MGAITLTKETFLNEIQSGVTLVDSWAPWCGPCKIQLPIVEELAGELKGQATLLKSMSRKKPNLPRHLTLEAFLHFFCLEKVN
ncbi:hypothetical protein CS562_03840 [Paenibacillus sp. LK1]|nr:hypothetical protein CS562_03840 [Paenibacillus sp. LK1]